MLESIARECTRPRRGHSYRDPQHVKVMFQIARRSHTSEDWKRALRERKQARQLWMEEKIRAATKGDWGAYRETTKTGSTGLESHFACAMPENVDPHQAVHDHLQGVYGGGGLTSVPDFPFAEVGSTGFLASLRKNFTMHSKRVRTRSRWDRTKYHMNCSGP